MSKYREVEIEIWQVGWRTWMWSVDYVRLYPLSLDNTTEHQWAGLATSLRQARRRVGFLLTGSVPPRTWRLPPGEKKDLNG